MTAPVPPTNNPYSPDDAMQSQEERVEQIIDMFRRAIRTYSKSILNYVEDDDGEGEEPESINEEQIDEWVDAMRKSIATYHTAAALIGSDTGELNDQQKEQVKDKVKTQIDYLGQFEIRIRTDEAFDRAFLSRAESYASAVRTTFYQSVTNFLPLPAMPGEGTLCHNNCKCGWEIVEVNQANFDFDCYWRRGATDSCGTCIAREREWSPLQIRNGSLV
jgi:hypothetical protein